MKPVKLLVLVTLLGSLMSGCSGTGYIEYQPPFLPVILGIDSFGDVSVSWEGSLQTPLGTFSVGASQSTSLIGEKYEDQGGVLVVNVNGVASVYDLDGNENISIKLESGYYEQVEFRKEGKNWYFEARKIPDASIAEVSLVNEHCDPIDFYIDGQKVVDAMPAETSDGFSIEAGYYETMACVAGTQSCGDAVTVNWDGTNNTHTIYRSSTCSEMEPTVNSDQGSTCDQPITMSNISPYTPTLKPRTPYTAILTFYNPNDCDVHNLRFTIGWQNDLSGPSGFSIPIIYAKRYAEVPINLTAPGAEGDQYFTFYSLESYLCDGLCTPVFIYANVKKK